LERTAEKLKFLNDMRGVVGKRKTEILKLLTNLILKVNFDALGEFHRRVIFIGAMHFQDPYNLDFERLKRCGVHYVTPDKRLIPFCAYNNFHYRKEVEEKFSKPVVE